MNKPSKIDNTLQVNNIETRQENEENNYHFLKRLFIDNKSNFSFVQKIQEYYHSYAYKQVIGAMILAWILIGYIWTTTISLLFNN